MLVAVRASFWRPVLPVTFAAMPYNAGPTRSATAADAWCSNFLQFSDNFGLAALVRPSSGTPSGKRARLGSMEVSTVGATQDGAVLCGHVSYSFNTGIYKL